MSLANVSEKVASKYSLKTFIGFWGCMKTVWAAVHRTSTPPETWEILHHVFCPNYSSIPRMFETPLSLEKSHTWKKKRKKKKQGKKNIKGTHVFIPFGYLSLEEITSSLPRHLGAQLSGSGRWGVLSGIIDKLVQEDFSICYTLLVLGFFYL